MIAKSVDLGYPKQAETKFQSSSTLLGIEVQLTSYLAICFQLLIVHYSLLIMQINYLHLRPDPQQLL
jgi:hypothetical protein